MIGSLTLDQLRVLVTIAETGSFSAAGRRLGRAQSAISQTIATLENVQGIALFDRSAYNTERPHSSLGYATPAAERGWRSMPLSGSADASSATALSS